LTIFIAANNRATFRLDDARVVNKLENRRPLGGEANKFGTELAVFLVAVILAERVPAECGLATCIIGTRTHRGDVLSAHGKITSGDTLEPAKPAADRHGPSPASAPRSRPVDAFAHRDVDCMTYTGDDEHRCAESQCPWAGEDVSRNHHGKQFILGTYGFLFPRMLL